MSASPVAVAWAINPLASLHAMRGEFDVAEGLLREANETLRELGGLNASSTIASDRGRSRRAARLVEARCARPRGSARWARQAAGDDERDARPGAVRAGRFDEAGAMAVAAAGAARGRHRTQIVWRGVLAKLLARGQR